MERSERLMRGVVPWVVAGSRPSGGRQAYPTVYGVGRAGAAPWRGIIRPPGRELLRLPESPPVGATCVGPVRAGDHGPQGVKRIEPLGSRLKPSRNGTLRRDQTPGDQIGALVPWRGPLSTRVTSLPCSWSGPVNPASRRQLRRRKSRLFFTANLATDQAGVSRSRRILGSWLVAMPGRRGARIEQFHGTCGSKPLNPALQELRLPHAICTTVFVALLVRSSIERKSPYRT